MKTPIRFFLPAVLALLAGVSFFYFDPRPPGPTGHAPERAGVTSTEASATSGGARNGVRAPEPRPP